MRSLLKYATFLMIGTFLTGTSVIAQKQGAKALFYDPVTGVTLKPPEKRRDPQTGMVKVNQAPADKVKYVGIHFWIELEGVGPVTANRTFYTGDRIRLHVRSNVDGYLSLWTLDSSGRGELLFPQPGQAEGDNFVKADTEYVTPGFIKFAPPAQEERFVIFFSRNKELHSPTAPVVAEETGPRGEKALVFETDDKNPDEIGTYVVNKKGGPVAVEVRLKHQPRSGEQ
jgi:hypothetical protein